MATDYTYVDGYEVNETYVDTQIIDITDRKIGKIKNQTSTKGENVSQLLTFRVDRFPDGYDLTNTTIKIHYQYTDEDGKIQGGDNSPINVKANDEDILLGWLIPSAATQIAQIIQFMIYAVADGYVYKTLPKNYAIKDTLDIGGGITQPDNSWYLDFIVEMDAKVAAAEIARDRAETAANTIEENLAASREAVGDAESAATYAEEMALKAAEYASKYVEYTLVAANWDTTEQTYSFEADYPFAEYNIEVEPSGTITATQLELWNAALIVGSSDGNIIKALGVLPGVDIPVMIRVVATYA